ncbi:AraC family transcriptional regulator [Flavitalea sp. BT771]|uniref:AraC family transcriptional regulator n=1 Tax=Flavitalea sp. BT771 TaxID=3063329 RepID=UPI0026E350D6|nr:AraC family transcriptional regulator [Flavitalea sp. BT771]MDO6430379.1 AraC family transcriptional regulator [Flavitalea sp. BT771]MDV6219481.1 AraC family transcriptional regulator [Flavitalea sp. BT771]
MSIINAPMSGSSTDTEHKRRIAHVIDYIFGHPDSQISLETLAGIAHYSPFHLQKLFKQIIGDSPKQYTIKLRLETAFHLLIIHPQRSIQEISIESGFSSPAVFSRAMKRFFGYSPEQIRDLPHRKKMMLLHAVAPKSAVAQAGASGASLHTGKVPIHTVKKESVKGIYLTAPFDNPAEIQRSFAELSMTARSNDWLTPGGMYGILSPHLRNMYRAFLPVDPEMAGTGKFTFAEIKGGNFATFKVRGDLKQTNKVAHYFYQRWLPDSGYKIAGVTGFERFSGDPAVISYYQLEREVHIPIEPVR